MSEEVMSNPQKTTGSNVGCSWYMKLTASIIIGVTLSQIPSQILLATGAAESTILIVGFGTLIATGILTWIGLGKIKVKPRPEKLSGVGPQVSTYEWSYFEHKSSGLRLPYPKNWMANEQSGKIIIHEANPRMISGGILELGMTLVSLDTSSSPLAGAADITVCKRWMETMLEGAGGTMDWSEEGKLSSGQPAIWFSYRFRKASADLKAVCVAAHEQGSLYYLDVTGLVDLIDGRLNEWKSIVHALEVRK